VAIISEATVRRYWPDQDPLGQSLRIGSPDSPPVEIIGIARDVVRNRIGEAPEPFIYLPFAQQAWGEMTLLVEMKGDPAAILGLVRREMRSLDSQVVPIFVDTQEQVVRAALFPQWAAAWLVGGLGLLASALAMAGLYGVVSYSVARRTHEIGVRIALGAQAGDTMRLILGEGLALAGVGLAIGLPVAFGLGRLLQSMLFGLSPTDPVTWFGSSALVIGVALLAAYFPGRRATRIDPMSALRAE
jgi:putative ABC transport system permease protein